jgi:hypothetical protein
MKLLTPQQTKADAGGKSRISHRLKGQTATVLARDARP